MVLFVRNIGQHTTSEHHSISQMPACRHPATVTTESGLIFSAVCGRCVSSTPWRLSRSQPGRRLAHFVTQRSATAMMMGRIRFEPVPPSITRIRCVSCRWRVFLAVDRVRGPLRGRYRWKMERTRNVAPARGNERVDKALYGMPREVRTSGRLGLATNLV